MTNEIDTGPSRGSSRRLPILLAILLPLAVALAGYRAYVAGVDHQVAASRTPETEADREARRRRQHERDIPTLDSNDLARRGSFDHLLSLRPDKSEWQDRFEELIAKKRSENLWLDQNFDHPGVARSTGRFGEQPGPTTREHLLSSQSLWDAVREDYERNSVDSPQRTATILEIFDRNFADWYIGDLGYEDDRQTIYSFILQGDIDPLVAILASTSESLDYPGLQALDQHLIPMVHHRTMSPVTLMLLCSEMGEHFRSFTSANRAKLSIEFEDRTPEILAARSQFPDAVQHYDLLLIEAVRIANGPVQGEWIAQLVDLSAEPETESLVPKELLNRMVGESCWRGSKGTRGGMFISDMETARLQLYKIFGHWAADHLLLAYVDRPDDPYIELRLAEIELALGATPLSLRQWYRIRKTSRCDSIGNAQSMARSLMPRWGGDIDQLGEFVEDQIDAAASGPDHRLHFYRPLEMYLGDRGYHHNWVSEDSFGPSLVKLAKSSLQSHEGIDRRFNHDCIATVIRSLWDAAELETLSRWMQTYGDIIPDNRINQYKTPAWLVGPTIAAHDCPGVPRDAIETLHQHLMVAPDRYDSRRNQLVEEALGTVDAFVESLSISDTEGDCVRMMVRYYHAMHGVQQEYERGDPVDLVAKSLPWTHQGGTVTYNEPINVRAYCNNSNLTVRVPSRFHPPYEVNMELNVVDASIDPFGIALSCGPVDRSAMSARTRWAVRYVPSLGTASMQILPVWRRGGSNGPAVKIEPNESTATLRMRVLDDSVEAWVNDQEVGRRSGSFGDTGIIHIFRNSKFQAKNLQESKAFAEYEIKRLTIQKVASSLGELN